MTLYEYILAEAQDDKVDSNMLDSFHQIRLTFIFRAEREREKEISFNIDRTD